MIRFTNQRIPKESPHFTFEEAHYMTLCITKGIQYTTFLSYSEQCPFAPHEWCDLLDISRHTMMRMKKGNKRFSKLQTETILQLTLLCRYGKRELQSTGDFRQWLLGDNRSHGKPVPRMLLLHSSFGIQVLIDEVRRGW